MKLHGWFLKVRDHWNYLYPNEYSTFGLKLLRFKNLQLLCLEKYWFTYLLHSSFLGFFSFLAFSYCFGSIEKENRERRETERLRKEITLYGGLLQRDRELEFNFRVNLIWVGWVNFNLGGFFFIWIGLIFFGLGCF